MRLLSAFLFFIPFLVVSQEVHRAIFPEPRVFQETGRKLELPDLISVSNNADGQSVVQLFSDIFGVNKLVLESSGKPFIQLQIRADFPDEKYRLEIKNTGITIEYKSYNGLIYAFESLRQLVNDPELPLVTIEDEPAFGYRGVHLDCSRHFYTVSEIKSFLDELAYLKFNRFHWHLTDDQGWRIEIKQFPLLTSVGAWRDSTLIGHYSDMPWKFDRTRYGGFYTQDEAREIVAYAGKLGIEVIPEIELPGHARAALAAYPDLSCTGEKLPVAAVWGVFDEVFCTKDQTLNFLKAILTEVAGIFPSHYVHIGGDEVPKTNWKKCNACQENIQRLGLNDEHELQSYVIQEMEKHLNTLGKSIIGWDEILEGGLAPNATVMSWRGMEGGQAAAAQHHSVIMTPTTYCYFDYYQSSHPQEPLAIGGYLPLEKVYRFNPVAGVDEVNQSYILGGQANIWTEYLPDFKRVQYHAFPRLAAMAEVLWNRTAVPYEAFVDALVVNYVPHLQAKGINFSNAYLDPKLLFTSNKEGISIAIEKPISGVETRLGNDEMSAFRIFRTDEVHMLNLPITAQLGSAVRTLNYRLTTHAALGIPVEFKTPPHPKYNNNGNLGLTDGVIGVKPWKGSEWLGFEKDTVVFSLEFEKEISPKSMVLYLLNDPGSWIYLPKELWVEWIGKKGKKGVVKINIDHEKMEISGVKKAKKIQFTVINNATIPEGKPGAGFTPWTFISELVIEK